MTPGDAEIDALVAALAADPGFAAFAKPDAALIVWDLARGRIRHASPAAEPLARALTLDDTMRIDPRLPALERLRALGGGLAPRSGGRLERLRLSPNALVPLATCACRLVTLNDGREVLLTGFPGPLPKLSRPAAPAAEPAADEGAPAAQPASAPDTASAPEPEPAPAGLDDPAAPEPVPAPPVRDPFASVRARGSVRFLWQADAEARFVQVSEALAEVVGGESAAVVGRTWDELLGDVVDDPSGIVAEVLARGETWSGRTVFWRIAGTDHAVATDLAGMPVLDRERRLTGFRGFGLLRTDAIVERPRRVPDVPVEAAAAGGETEAGSDEIASPIGELGAGKTPTEGPLEGDDPTHRPEARSPSGLSLEGGLQDPQRPLESSLEAADAASQDEDGGLDGPGFEPGYEADRPVERAAEAVVQDAAAEQTEPAEAEGPAFEGPEPELATVADAPPTDDVDPSVPVADADLILSPEPDSIDLPAEGSDAGERTEPASATQTDAQAQPDAPPPSAVATAFSAIAGAVTALLGSPRPPPLRAEGSPPQADDAAEPPSPAGGPVAARLGAPPVPLKVVEEAEPAAARDDTAQAESAEAATHSEPAAPAEAKPPATRLSTAERSAFREIARALGARFEDEETSEPPAPDQPGAEIVSTRRPTPEPMEAVARAYDRLPVGILVHRGETALFANRPLLDMLGYADREALAADGGLRRLFHGRPGALAQIEGIAPVALATRGGETIAAEIRLTAGEWGGYPASVMLIRKVPDADPSFRLRALELDLRARDLRVRELSSILDTATDGVIVLDDIGRILSLNRSAEALFGYDQNEVTGESLTILLAPEGHVVALDYLEGLRTNGVATLLNDGREVLGRVRQGGVIPLFMTMGQVSEGPERKFCAVLRDITAFKKAEGELLAAKRAAEEASAQKSDFLAKISHEIRTPLNAIIGFAEVMREERFGPVGNERYQDYLADIHSSGQHVISLVNDLLDLAKVEAGRMELAFTGVSLNELVTACVGLMQPQAARDRIVLRTSFAHRLPPVVADERSMRQIVLNLLSNAVKFTDAGGQVIVSTAVTDRGEVAFRVRDTGIGMSPQEIEAALEPFRQLNTARKGGGTGLGLPLTKALVEANRGALQITSAKHEGTLVEVLFPPTRVLAE